MVTKMVAAWSTALFWEVFTHPCKCKPLLKLRLDVVLGDSSAPPSGEQICSVDADLEIFNKSIQHISKDVSSKI